MVPLGADDPPFRLQDWNRGRSLISHLRWSEPWLYWVEMRFEEGGRSVLLRARIDGDRVGSAEEPLPSGVTVRSDVYEYGGGAYAIAGDRLVHVDGRDGSVWSGGALLVPSVEGHRYGDLDAAPDLITAVRERHPADGLEPEHDIVLISADGTVRSVASGRDFYAAPRLSSDGRRLCFLAWDHPWLPWDAAELHVLELATGAVRWVAGGAGTELPSSVVQPRWSEDGSLLYLHDETGHWEPRLMPRAGEPPVSGSEVGRDLAAAPWALGVRSSDVRGRSVYAASPGPDPVLIRWGGAPSGPTRAVPHDFESITEVVCVGDDTLILLASRTGRPEGVHLFRPGETGRLVATTRRDPPPPEVASPPLAVTFRARDGAPVPALWFAPTGSARDPSPVIVNAHGGPTYGAWVPLDYRVQFWTARGYGVLDVDYRGSSGHGRAYRDALYGHWGRIDVDDCVDGARWLVERGLADPARLVIRGESAGGYTALCAAAYERVFAVAIAHYGVSEPMLQGDTTHKLEHHYVGRLLGSEPPRSPLAHVGDVEAGLLLTHGSDDVVVPPEQTRLLAEAARAAGIRVRHLELPGEGHGYRRAESVVRVRQAELETLTAWLP